MKKIIDYHRLFTAVFLAFFSLTLFAQNLTNWNKVNKLSVKTEQIRESNMDIDRFQTYSLNLVQITNELKSAPFRHGRQTSKVLVDFPLGEETESFQIYRAETMSNGLAKKFPQIQSYVGRSTDGTSRIRVTITPQGLFAMISTEGRRVFINPYDKKASIYQVFDRKDARQIDSYFQCLAKDVEVRDNREKGPGYLHTFDDGKLRKYRLAVGTSDEFSNYHIEAAGLESGSEEEKKTAVLAAIIVVIDRVNEVFEVDFGITLCLVPDNEEIIFIDSGPFSNGSNAVNEAKEAIPEIIGSENFDIGHVMTTGSGGAAYWRVVCRDTVGYKAGGTTGLPFPMGDVFAIDYVSHEIGHQFGAKHTFSSNYGSCAPHGEDSTAVEPGSGSTIMGYAGICDDQDVQSNSDSYFSFKSIEEVWGYIKLASGGTCGEEIEIVNTAPEITPLPSDYNIPYGTAFKLDAEVTDPDGDYLTYTWEQNDPKKSTPAPPSPDATEGPMFRSVLPTSTSVRYFPNKNSVLQGDLTPTWEVVPSVARQLNFALTVRDNNPVGGQTARENIKVNVKDTGPFKVTSQDEAGIFYQSGDEITISWDVAGTTGNDINADKVNILLSYDNGQEFSHVLASDVGNSGSANVNLPQGECSDSCRIMIEAADNIFYAVNATVFTIGGEDCGIPIPPINNNCTTAIEIPVTPGMPTELVAGTMKNATASLTEGSDCECESTPEDVWFKAQIPASGVLNIETFVAGGTTSEDNNYSMELFYGNCGNLNYYFCNKDGNYQQPADLMPSLSFTGSEGLEVLIRVRKTAVSQDDFYIAAYDPKATIALSDGNCDAAPIDISRAAGNADRWVPLLDTEGKLIGEINSEGEDLGEVLASANVHSGNLREDGNGIPYLNRNYTINMTGQPSKSISMILYFNQADFDALKSASDDVGSYEDLVLTRTIGACEDEPVSVDGVLILEQDTYKPWEGEDILGLMFTTDHFSSFFIHGGSSPLPVVLTSFNAQPASKNSVLLDWVVTDEINLDSYIVERSRDGIDFDEIGRIKADNLSAYQMTDKNPTNGANYYRLKMMDIDKSFSISEVRKVTITTSGSIALYPNPTYDRFFISGLENIQADAQITIYNEIGQQVWRNVMDGSSLASQGIDLATFPIGAYHIKVTSQEVNEVMRIVKQ